MCLYVSISVCLYLYMSDCVSLSIYFWLCVSICLCLYLYICIYRICVSICLGVFVSLSVCVGVCVCVCVCVCVPLSSRTGGQCGGQGKLVAPWDPGPGQLIQFDYCIHRIVITYMYHYMLILKVFIYANGFTDDYILYVTVLSMQNFYFFLSFSLYSCKLNCTNPYKCLNCWITIYFGSGGRNFNNFNENIKIAITFG